MHTLYTAADPLEAEILRCYLAEHGIASQILGAGLWSAVGELPVNCWPRLMLETDDQLPVARELLRRYEHRRHAGASWLCGCGERSPLHFEVCWNCGDEAGAGTMIEIALYQPEIPPNTGNIIRLCANCGADLHLIHPLGFRIDDASLRRAGLDYHEMTRVHEHASLSALQQARPAARWFAFTTRGKRPYHEVQYRDGDVLLFGPETRGLPQDVLDTIAEDQRIYLPMQPGNRSLNLSNAVAVAAFEAWRQLGFNGAAQRNAGS